MLLDEFAHLRKMISERNPAVSEISKLKVLGYHKLRDTEYQVFEAIFKGMQVIAISSEIID